MKPVVFLLVVACSATPPARTPTQRHADSAPATTALRAARFDEAARGASAALALDPHNSQAAAVRAIARYQAAGVALHDGIEELAHQAGEHSFFDHANGRAMWSAVLDQLDAIDRDLAVVAADRDFSLELCLACWEYDWNRSGRVDEHDRALFEIESDGLGASLPVGDPRRRPTFRFDVGDAEWARAMIAFQRAAVELVLAYRWSELDKVFARGGGKALIVIHLVDGGRVTRARELILAGLDHADRCRDDYLAETDDDREWVPNPHQKSHPVPLDVDDKLYATWAAITHDARRLVASEEGVSLPDLAALIEPHLPPLPDAQLDLGRMLREPTDITIDLAAEPSRGGFEHILRGLLGHGYATGMRASPLVGRLRAMQRELDSGADTLGQKLRYLFWLN